MYETIKITVTKISIDWTSYDVKMTEQQQKYIFTIQQNSKENDTFSNKNESKAHKREKIRGIDRNIPLILDTNTILKLYILKSQS